MQDWKMRDEMSSIYGNWTWYTPPTTTRLNCRVESRRRSVLNSQLVHDGFGLKIENWTCWEFIQSELAAKLETGSRLPTGEYTSPDTTQLECSVFNFSTKHVGSRRELVANSIHTALSRRDSTRQLSHVGVGVVCWAIGDGKWVNVALNRWDGKRPKRPMNQNDLLW